MSNNINSKNNSESLHIFGVEKFWHASRNLIEQKFGNNIEEERIDDQLQKLNLAYRLIQTSLEDKIGDGFKPVLKNIIQETEDLFPAIYEENLAFLKDDNLSDKYNQDVQLKYISDKILKCLLKNLDKNHSGLIDSEVIEELFSKEVASEMYVFKCPIKIENQKYKKEVIIPPKTKKRSIEDLDQECGNTFFAKNSGDFIFGKEIEKNKNSQLNKLKLAYGLAKWKFQGVNRQSGERYFEHLREVAHVIMREGEHSNFDQVLISILHDIMEDTNISINTISKLFGKKIALAVHLISKKSCIYYADDNHEENIEQLKKSSIINNNLLLCDRVKSVLRNVKESQKLKNIIFSTSNEKFSNDEKTILIRSGLNYDEVSELELFNKLNIKYKNTRNEDYFGHIKNKKLFTEYTKDEAIKLGWYSKSSSKKLNNNMLTEKDINEVADNSILVKIADRLHNLRTLRKTGIEKTRRKIKETLEYFMALVDDIGGETREKVWVIIYEIEKLMQESGYYEHKKR